MAARVAAKAVRARGDSGDMLHGTGRDADLGQDQESMDTHTDLELDDLENVDTRPKQGSTSSGPKQVKKQAKAVVQTVEEQWGLTLEEGEVVAILEALQKSGQPQKLNVAGKEITFSLLHGSLQIRAQGKPGLAV